MKYNKLAIWGFILTVLLPTVLTTTYLLRSAFPFFYLNYISVIFKNTTATPITFAVISLLIGFIISILAFRKIKGTEEKGKNLSIFSIIFPLFYFALYISVAFFTNCIVSCAGTPQ